VTVILTVVGVVVAPRGAPVTITLYEPATTEDATLIIRTLEAPVEDGVTEGGLNEMQMIPEGRGVPHESVTD